MKTDISLYLSLSLNLLCFIRFSLFDPVYVVVLVLDVA